MCFRSSESRCSKPARFGGFVSLVEVIPRAALARRAGGRPFLVPVFYIEIYLSTYVSGFAATFVLPVREAEQGEPRSAGERTDRAGTAAHFSLSRTPAEIFWRTGGERC